MKKIMAQNEWEYAFAYSSKIFCNIVFKEHISKRRNSLSTRYNSPVSSSIKSFWSGNAIWCHELFVFTNIGLGKILLADLPKKSPEPILIYFQLCIQKMVQCNFTLNSNILIQDNAYDRVVCKVVVSYFFPGSVYQLTKLYDCIRHCVFVYNVIFWTPREKSCRPS